MSSAHEAGANLFRREYDLDNPEVSLPPVANLCNTLLKDAFHSQARSIRLVLAETELGSVEYELDSQWRVIAQLPAQVFGAFINRLKVMAALDIGRVAVQEGELHVRLNGRRHVLAIRTEVTSSPYDLVTVTGLAESAT